MNFKPKGRQPKNSKYLKVLRKTLNTIHSTILEGNFGTEKEHYSLRKVKARTKNNEIFWIVFGIHSTNLSRLASRIVSMSKKIKQTA